MPPRLVTVGRAVALAWVVSAATAGGASAAALAGVDTSGTVAPALTAGAPLPPPDVALPRDPRRLAQTLTVTTRGLRAAVDRWRARGNPAAGGPPHDVVLLALHHQRIVRLLRHDDALARATLPHVAAGLRRDSESIVAAGRALGRITPALQARKLRTRQPLPVGVLLRHYREAERRFGVPWYVLAAVNFVESAFGKIRTDSAAGAQGPMQFMPATWRAYGLGGNVHDDRDAILGAANYLRRSGAPRDLRRALWHYNHSTAYVGAVLRYSRLIERDPRYLYAFYGWQLIVRTERGDLRLTGPGR